MQAVHNVQNEQSATENSSLKSMSVAPGTTPRSKRTAGLVGSTETYDADEFVDGCFGTKVVGASAEVGTFRTSATRLF
jgi:hypothetical protein